MGLIDGMDRPVAATVRGVREALFGDTGLVQVEGDEEKWICRDPVSDEIILLDFGLAVTFGLEDVDEAATAFLELVADPSED